MTDLGFMFNRTAVVFRRGRVEERAGGAVESFSASGGTLIVPIRRRLSKRLLAGTSFQINLDPDYQFAKIPKVWQFRELGMPATVTRDACNAGYATAKC